MEQSKLIKTLSVLTESELKAFRKWGSERVKKENNDIIRLFDYWFLHKEDENKKLFEKEKVFCALYPNLPYDDDRVIRRIMSDLLSLLKEYIILHLQKDDFQRDMMLAEFYLNRNVFDEFSIVLDEIERKQNSIPVKTELNYYQKYAWEKIKMVESGLEQISQKKANLEPAVHSLNIFYLSSALRWHCLVLNNNGSNPNIEDNVHFPSVVSIVKYNEAYLSHPLIALYYQTYCLWNELDNINHYDDLELWLEKNEQFISIDDQATVAKCMRNYCIRKMRLGQKHFYAKFEKLMNNHLAKGFLFEIGHIAPIAFNNMIILYLRQNKIAEAEKFVAEYQDFLKEENKESVLCLTSIKIDFANQKYKEVLQKSSTMESSPELILQIESRRCRAKAFFMLEEQELLNACLEAFRVHLYRIKPKLGEYRFKSYKLFLKYMHKIIIINLFDKKLVQDLANKIVKEGDFVEKEWMLDVLEAKGAIL